MTITYDSPGIDAKVAPVCSGDDLELICTLPGRALEWNIILMPPEDMTFEYPVNSVAQSIPVHTITVSNISFTFSRVSSPGNTHPLMSRLLINDVTVLIDYSVSPQDLILYSSFQVVPAPSVEIETVGRRGIRIRVLYNTFYNVSVTGPCAMNSNIVLFYGKFL